VDFNRIAEEQSGFILDIGLLDIGHHYYFYLHHDNPGLHKQCNEVYMEFNEACPSLQ